jgi:hypothetical protein
MRTCLVLFIFLFSITIHAQDTTKTIVENRTISAVRITQAPKIDGKLNDAAWHGIPVVTGFKQLAPFPGKSAHQKTDVQLVYDNTAIYIAATLYDVDRDSIMQQLCERDDEKNTDLFGLFLDTYNDDQNGYGFVVHSTGVQWDARYSENGDQDEAWNAVWQSAVSMDEKNWYVEIKIPYSAIRFPDKPEQTWGINFARKIKRFQEFSFWNTINPSVSGFISQFGELKGIENIESPVRLSFSPYVSGYLEHYPFNEEGTNNWSTSLNGGMDLKYGINDAFTLDMTLIPDFGQVQSDNQVLNLTPFEVRFNENRQFFTEGTELFNKGDLFYSRRVGAEPIAYEAPYYEMEDTEEIEQNPETSQLLNATKLSGRTSGGLGIGIFNGITKPMYATLRDTITEKRRKVTTDPLTNYNVLVLDQNLKNNSSVTLVNTNVTRSGSFYDANVTGALFDFHDKENIWTVNGSGMLSQQMSATDRNTGHALFFSTEKESGNFQFGIDYYEYSDTYDPTDLGFLTNNNERNIYPYLGYYIFEPFGKFLDLSFELDFDYYRLYNPDAFMEMTSSIDISGTLKNFYSFSTGYTSSLGEGHDFFEARVPGRIYTYNPINSAYFYLASDYRKAIRLEGSIAGNFYTGQDRKNIWLYLSSGFRISDKLSIVSEHTKQWSTNDEGAALNLYGEGTIIGDDIIFGKRELDVYENNIQVSYIFNNKMGLTFRLRHYWSKVKYNSFHVLGENGHLYESDYEGIDTEGESLHNTSFNAFNIDMVYRWVFAPGSELSMVWKNSIIGYDNQVNMNYLRDVRNTIELPQVNSFSIKLLYYIDYLSLKKKK